MDFSDLFKQSNQLCSISYNGMHLANAVQYKLVVRDYNTLQIVNLFTNLDAINAIEWSPDSQFVMCVMKKRGLVQVWSLEEPDWTCKIDEGSAGLNSSRWSPDSRHILTTSEFHLRMTVWSLIDKSVSYIKHPKDCQRGVDFTQNGKYMALAERRECKDCISIFTCNTWQLLKHFETETDDLAGVQWSPDSEVLCIWESNLSYKVLLYSLDGRLISSYSAYEHALGIKSLSWSPSAQFLAVGSFDQQLRILNHMTWRCVTAFGHPAKLERKKKVIIYKECEEIRRAETDEKFPNGPFFNTMTKFEICRDDTITLTDVKPDPKKANPKVGPSQIAFSPDNRYIFSRNDNMPNTLWIWDIENIRLSALLVNISTIKCVRWDPTQSRLALCTGNKKVYMWSPSGALVVEVPIDSDFSVCSLQWHSDGKSLLLMGKDEMCVCYLQE